MTADGAFGERDRKKLRGDGRDRTRDGTKESLALSVIF